ncbi:MAG: arginine--tRNA ligase [Gammaproteobacteria bacterium]|jgi:arginyl-tRNA synthetase|nr:arginine--tRNA ligase [Gammaproteobacteria bacterium]|tara:strand:+ start:4135 stop:5874 length:1740 start_codon:yes stop_codon:yes gene_type:complete
MQTIKQYLNQLVSQALGKVADISAANANVITASRPEFGDYQANGIMAIAKQMKTNPRELAIRVVAELDTVNEPLVASFKIAGPGFININLNSKALCERANLIRQENNPLISTAEQPSTIVIDFSSPNLAKEMHVGHLRGTIIGDCLARVLETKGHRIIRQNHVGDWGTQFGMLIAYLQEVSADTEELPTRLADLETFYRAAKERFDSDPSFAESARQSVVKLQSGDSVYLDIWKQFIEESLSHCEAIYSRLNVTLSRSDLCAESFYNKELEDIVNKLDNISLITVSDGAKCVFLPEFSGKDGTPLPTIIQKSDGGYLYATTDLAAARYRYQKLEADRALYVVDARQSLHFQQVFAVARKAEFVGPSLSLEHIAYGTMMGADGKPFKTRSGGIVKLKELLDEGVKRAFDLVTEKNPQLDETLRRQIAERTGIAAIKYADLSKNRTSDYIFEWSSMLSFDGNTAPYLMYAYARIRSILNKHEVKDNNYSITLLSSNEERNLLLKILQLSEIVDAVAADCYPNQLCNYLYELAGIFMRFYEACPILQAEGEVKISRLALAAFTAEALAQGLDLLGIEPLEQM